MLFGIFFLCSVSFLRAQSGDETSGSRITGLSVTGLKRTRLSTAERPLKKFIGLEAGLLDTNDVWAAVMNTGILEPLSVEIQAAEAGGNVLVVTVREKWPIFPVPVVMAGSGGFTAGGALFHANAFGLNDKVFMAGLYRTGGWVVTAGYIHASSGGRVPGWNGMAVFSREERHDGDQRNEDLRRFELDSLSLRAGLNFSLLENSDLLSASPYFSFNEKTLRNSEAAMNGPDEGLRLFGAGLGLSLNNSSWDGYLLSQQEAFIQYSFRVAADGYSYQSFNLRGIWEKPLVPGFKFNIRTGLVLEPDAPVLFESGPGGAQVDILPQSFSARNYAGASAGLEKYLLKFSAGTLSLAAAYQLVYSQGSVLEDSLDHGVAAKISFYMSQLAIPAVGVGAAYNVKENYFQGAFSLGMSF